MTAAVQILGPDEYRNAHELFGATIHRAPPNDASWAYVEPGYLPGRVHGVHAGSALVGTVMSWPSALAVPGGAVLPMAAITRVGVRPDHTRRGLLSAMMRTQLDDIVDRGEPVASLRASQAVIYGRFGYGVATRGRQLRVTAGRDRFRPDAPRGGTVRLLDRDTVVPTLTSVHERVGLRRPGAITRHPGWWGTVLARRVQVENVHLLAVVHTGPNGDDGFAVAHTAPGPDGDHDALQVTDLHAADAGATAGLWRFLLGVDLVDTVRAELRPLDEPLELLLDDPRACAVTGQSDETWLRLVDVPVALAARTYGAAGPVLLGVHDRELPGNTGVYRIADGAAERVGPLDGPVRPELECDVAALAMVYLGDRRPSELVAGGWWTAADPAAVGRADAAFATAEVPWCGTFF